MKIFHWVLLLTFVFVLLLLLIVDAVGRPPIRKDFFDVYPSAEFTRLDDLASNSGHCGVCHLDFDGGGPRNAYGLAVEVAINSGLYANDEDAIESLETFDSDGDGFSNLIEITSLIFLNTPTFPGLIAGDTASVSNVSIVDIAAYLTPEGSADSIPPVVTVISPNGGEVLNAGAMPSVTWSATDASGIDIVNIYLSDDGGTTYKGVALGLANSGSYSWFVPNRPGPNNLIRVEARDGAGNFGSDESDVVFTIVGTPAGYVPTTLRDMDLPGSQPLTVAPFEDPDVNCVTCHGNYDPAVEPWYQWKGSMMSHAMRDPLFLACVTVAEQDAPSVGDLCIRCHTPGGWLEGRSVDTSGNMVTAKDRQGVQCDFCHRLVDPIYQPGISPPIDSTIIAGLTDPPANYANGNFVVDPNPIRRGPYADAAASHAFQESPFHLSSNACGTCHDVSNPVFEADGPPGVYSPTAFDTKHPDGDVRNMFPVERTFSEYTMSEYASTGVFAPQFAGNLPSGIVSTCQDCHMSDASGKGCNEPGAPTRADLGVHDLTGGNYFIADILPMFFPGEVDVARLQAGKQRAINMLQLAATMALQTGSVGNQPTLTVTVTNETGHKLPSGYPEGRRAWLNVKAYDVSSVLIYESGAYDAGTGVLSHDADVKIYEIKLGVSSRLSPIIGLPADESFHFVLNDTVFKDNRIPPRGFTNANFETIQSPPVGYSYADGEYWDETEYVLPPLTKFVEVTLNYQTTSKEYIEFLRDENVTNTMGLDLYNAWVAQGRCAPVAMAVDTMTIDFDPTGIGDRTPVVTALYQSQPNPFNPETTIRYSLDERQQVLIHVFDVAGRRVTTLVDGERPAGLQQTKWYGTNANGERVASGVYFIRMQTASGVMTRRAVLLK